MGFEEILFDEIGRSKSRIPVMNDGVRVGTADLGRNGAIVVHLFGPFGRELEKLFVLGEFDDFSLYPNSKKDMSIEEAHERGEI
jgi:hypothetical protein